MRLLHHRSLIVLFILGAFLLLQEAGLATSFRHISSEELYEKSDAVVVARVMQAEAFHNAFAPMYFDKGSRLILQVEEVLRGPEGLSTVDYTRYGTTETKVGDRFLMFLAKSEHGYDDFGGGQGVSPIDEQNRVAFSWWGGDAFVEGQGYVSILVIPRVPLDGAVVVVKRVLAMKAEERTLEAVTAGAVTALHGLDFYDVFSDPKAHERDWAMITLERLASSYPDAAIQQAARQALQRMEQERNVRR